MIHKIFFKILLIISLILLYLVIQINFVLFVKADNNNNFSQQAVEKIKLKIKNIIPFYNNGVIKAYHTENSDQNIMHFSNIQSIFDFIEQDILNECDEEERILYKGAENTIFSKNITYTTWTAFQIMKNMGLFINEAQIKNLDSPKNKETEIINYRDNYMMNESHNDLKNSFKITFTDNQKTPPKNYSNRNIKKFVFKVKNDQATSLKIILENGEEINNIKDIKFNENIFYGLKPTTHGQKFKVKFFKRKKTKEIMKIIKDNLTNPTEQVTISTVELKKNNDENKNNIIIFENINKINIIRKFEVNFKNLLNPIIEY